MYKWDDWVGRKQVEVVPQESQVEEQNNVEKSPNGDVQNNSNDAKKDEDESKNMSPPAVPEENLNPEETAEDQESEAKKNRRRCSDLDFLKEWGWHKNRRSNRKKQKEEEETVDTTINGHLRRILPSYFTQSFEHTKSNPFIPDTTGDENRSFDGELLDTSKTDAEDEQKFNELSKESFEEFMATFKERGFDLYIPIYQWVRFVSLYWNKTVIPPEIIALYKKIYPIYEGYIEYHGMYRMPEDDFLSSFRAAMFYFELIFDEFEETKAEISDDFMRKKELLQANIGFIEDDMDCTRMLLRLIWLSYGIQIYHKSYKDALGYLYKVEEVFDVPKYKEISIELKNCKQNKLIDFKTTKDLIVKIERKMNLASVKQLYETQNYSELIDILQESIIYSTGPKVNVDSLTLKIQAQIQILLEAYFSLNRIEECLSFAEKSLFYSYNHFLTAPTEFRLEEWATLVNFCLVYIEAIIKEDGSEMLYTLGDKLPRLVQTLTQIISSQLDVPLDKNCPKLHLINLTSPWIILYPLVQRQDDIANALSGKKKEGEDIVEDLGALPNSLMMLFTAHEFLGRKQWCMKDNGKLWIFLLDNLISLYRTPLLEPHRDIIYENLEQTTFCLYGFPAKKARLRHIEDHDARNIELTWERAIQLFDLYRPDNLPEFDSIRNLSITSEMEQLLQRIILLIPKCLDIYPFTAEIKSFINGTTTTLPKEMNILPSKISTIYYLLADHYFKNQETAKAIKYFTYDLAMFPNRFDSWAAMSLCKQSKLEKRLNSFEAIDVKSFLELADQAINCFNQCLDIKKTSTIVTEFASFTYHLHSFCSRSLKQASENMSMENFAAIEERKDKFLDIALKCFTDVSLAITDPAHELNSSRNQDDSDDNHEERWLCWFMLGKIAEKKKDPPVNFLNHYLKSGKYLYEDNATYPIKINHNNPTHLSIESLEVFYRITACIMKYLEQHSKINKPTAKLFIKVLKDLSTSPFAYNRAKINEDNINALKRKMNTSVGEGNSKQQKLSKTEDENTAEKVVNEVSEEKDKMEIEEVIDENRGNEKQQKEITPPVIKKAIATEGGSRRGSQESAMTSTTTTSATHSSSTSSDSSSDSSDSDSSSSDESDQENIFVDQEQINTIYKMCIKNLEECVSRFPEHYKSIYRLVYHFLNVNVDLEKCRQLLLTSNYKTTLGNSINGLFSERKSNNFFNGIWRIPTAEIDRPGNFTSHLSKCIIILMDVLKKTNEHEILLDLAMQLQKVPENDKKYLIDSDRKELYQQALACCVQAFKNKLKDVITGMANGTKNDRDLLELMLDVFKSHRRTYKNVSVSKDQNVFSGVMIEVYKEYVKDHMTLSENANFCDLAFKKCQQELNYRKNLEKGIITPNPNPVTPIQAPKPIITPATTTSPLLIKSVSEINKSVTSTAGSNQLSSSQSTPSNSKPRSSSPSAKKQRTNQPSKNSSASSTTATQQWLNSMIMALYGSGNAGMMSSSYMSEYYKMLGMSSSSAMSSMGSLLNDPTLSAALLAGTTGSPSSSPTPSAGTSKGFDTKMLESLMKSNYGIGLQQNLISNSLSITTTTITPTTTSSSASKAQTSVSKKADIKSQSRKSLATPPSTGKGDNLSTKYSALFGSGLKLPELPKSLSITPSVPQKQQQPLIPKEKKREKNMAAMKALGKFNLNPSLSITPDSPKTPTTSKQSLSKTPADMHKSFEDFLKSYPHTQPAMVATNKKPAPVTVTSHGMTSQSKQQQKSQINSNVQSKSSKSNPGPKMPYDFGKNIASSFMPSSMHSPTLSSSPFSHTPPLSSSPHASSSPKTLQQKLAERKQQNQKSSIPQTMSSSNSKKRGKLKSF